jgi:hypothetical protein
MMAGAARSALPGQGVTFVNLPYFFSSRGKGTECRNPFVFAPTGAVVVPPYADARDFVRYNGGPDISASAITVREYQPGWQTFGAQARVEQVRQQLAASRVFVFDLVRWRFFDLSAAWQPDAPANQAQAILNGVTISNFKFQMTNGKSVATLTWQSAAMIQDRQVFVHVYDSSGKLAAQADSAPAEGFVPTSWWRAGDVITDVHSVNTTNLPSGVYRVTVGMYDAATGTRIEARDASGIRLPDDEVIIGKVTR